MESLSKATLLRGVDAVAIDQLPPIWQRIAKGEATVGHPEPDFLVALARLFLTKATDRSPEVFQQGFDFHAFYQQGAMATLDFFGHDFVTTAYPHFEQVVQTAQATDGADKVAAFVKDVFAQLGYALPACFYWMLLCPIERASIFEARPMFFDPRMQGVKRAYDACLHSLNVTAMLMLVQSCASRQGLLIQHGCGCDHALAQLIPGAAEISFAFESKLGRRKALTAYLWRCWNEYLLFPLGVHAQSLAL
ncbi:MAG: hypothetical protein QNJ46_25470 [Leptolyngbyaceae cyanobacterium MO_188.B28]|nr:hypothetical protein [Leptolyngbyaceae cyanobacterium MO_188.B28]